MSYEIDSKELKEAFRIDDVTWKKWKAMTEVNSKESIMRVYPIVMEATQKFDLDLDAVFYGFRMKSRHRNSNENHIKQLYKGGALTLGETNMLLDAVDNNYYLKEYLFVSEYMYQLEECSEFFLNSYTLCILGNRFLETKKKIWSEKFQRKPGNDD